MDHSQETLRGEPDLKQAIEGDIKAADRLARFRTFSRRGFLKLAAVTAAGLSLGGRRPSQSVNTTVDSVVQKINPIEALAPPIDIEFQVDERLKAKGKLTAVRFNNNFSSPKDLLRDAWWATAHAAWQRTNEGKISLDEYMDMVQQAKVTGDHAPIAFRVGGTDRRKSQYNMSTLEVDPLKEIKVVLVDDGVYEGQMLGMQRDVVRTDYAPDDKHGQNKITEITHKYFGFAKDRNGQLITIFNWDPSKLSRETKSVQLTEGFTEALSLLAYRNPGIHNMSSLPGTPEDEIAFFSRTSDPYRPLFGLDPQGDRIGLLTAPEFSK